MALQASGAISLSEIQTEHGGSNPISISEYYSADTGVPASGTIAISDFYGTTGSVTLTGASRSLASVSGTDPFAPYNIVTNSVTAGPVPANADGTITYSWSLFSGDAVMTCDSPNSATTTWSYNPGGSGTWNAVWRCTVTQDGTTSFTTDVTVNMDAGGV